MIRAKEIWLCHLILNLVTQLSKEANLMIQVQLRIELLKLKQQKEAKKIFITEHLMVRIR